MVEANQKSSVQDRAACNRYSDPMEASRVYTKLAFVAASTPIAVRSRYRCPSPRGYRTKVALGRYSLPFPLWRIMRIAATRPGFPAGALARGPDGARPRCSNPLFSNKREWQPRSCPTALRSALGGGDQIVDIALDKADDVIHGTVRGFADHLPGTAFDALRWVAR